MVTTLHRKVTKPHPTRAKHATTKTGGGGPPPTQKVTPNHPHLTQHRQSVGKAWAKLSQPFGLKKGSSILVSTSTSGDSRLRWSIHAICGCDVGINRRLCAGDDHRDVVLATGVVGRRDKCAGSDLRRRALLQNFSNRVVRNRPGQAIRAEQ